MQTDRMQKVRLRVRSCMWREVTVIGYPGTHAVPGETLVHM